MCVVNFLSVRVYFLLNVFKSISLCITLYFLCVFEIVCVCLCLCVCVCVFL